MSRRLFLTGVIVTGAALATATSPAEAAVQRGAGKYRSLALNNARTGEWIKTVYWADGEYIPEALDAFNHILRDWRAEKKAKMDPGVIDILSATQDLLDTTEPFEVVSGYRCRETNAMLRTKSRGVARNSYHVKGMAVDITMKSRTVRQISGAGLKLAAGGVGKYTSSKFVHLDSGPVRDWGR